ncbi:MAG: PAS domain S-box protein [Desulfobacterales bacterium]
MKDDHKTKKQLIDELTELRSQNTELIKSKSSEKYRLLVENIRDVIYELDDQGVVLYISPAVRDMLGFDSTEIVGKSFIDLAYKDDLNLVTEWFSELSKGIEKPSDYRVLNKSGELRWAQTKTRPVIEGGVFKGAHGVLIDVTAQRRTVEALRESEEKYRLSFENVADVIYVIDTNLNVLSVSPSVERILGYKPQDFIGRSANDLAIIFTPESFEQAIADISLILNGETIAATIYKFVAKNRTIKYGEVSVSPVMRDGKIIGIISIARDITDRKLAEEALRESEEKYRWVLDNMADVITVMDLNLRFTYVSPSVFGLRGYTAEEVMSQTMEQMMTPESLQIVAKVFEEEMKSEASGMADPGRTRILELEEYRKDGSIVWLENHISMLRDNEKKLTGIITLSSNITERKRAEEALRENEERYKALFDRSLDLVYITDFEGRFIDANQAALNRLGYNREEISSLNFATLLSEDQIPIAFQMMQEIIETGYQKNVIELRLKAKNGNDLFVETIGSVILKDGIPYAVQGIARDITERKLTEEALIKAKTLLDKTFASMDEAIFIVDSNTRRIIACNHATEFIFGFGEKDLIGCSTDVLYVDKLSYDLFGQELFPALDANGVFRTEFQMRRKDGSVFPTENTVTEILDDLGHRTSVVSVVRDVTERKQSEEKLQDTLESLRKSFGTIIQVMVSAVEARDPYTSGHQLRVADIARAIATEMGLSQEKIDGIRMAGSIHDIGKLSIPAEILSKPTKLSNIEFSLIKEHPLKGYEMIKDVESPWPLAQIVYQHHERMNGSGYPRNLKGDEILLEARIMAVADVVEAMASNRPYRPGKGIDAALEEIENGRGIFYDDAVADACLRLFREKGFKIETA